MKNVSHNKILDRRGMTLVEMMISLVIFGIVMGVVFSFLTGTRDNYEDTRTRVQYQQSMRAVMSLLTREIRSAGCDPDGTGFIGFTVAADNQLRCRMDLNGDGDTTDNQPDEDITYTFDAAAETLQRNDGGGDQTILRDVQNIAFSYFDAAGNALNALPLSAADRALVRYVEIIIAGETGMGEPVDYTTRVLVRNG